MSKQDKYFEELLNSEYDLQTTFRENEYVVIRQYKHKLKDFNIIYIRNLNRNDMVFRKLRGRKYPNLPMIYDVACSEDANVILEEYIDGQNLFDVMREELSKKDAIKYAIDVCNGLKVLHSKGIIHRDIKPANVMIDKDNNAVVIDLQAARLMSDYEENDTVNLGTAGYAAPEQYGVQQSTPATDIYAVGIMINEMVLRKHPSVETPKGKLGRVVNKCTNTQISHRYQNVDDLVKELNKIKRWV